MDPDDNPAEHAGGAVSRRGDGTALALLITAVGASQLVIAAFASGWFQGVLLNVGSTFLLAMPLLYLQRQVERLGRRTESAVTELRTEVQQAQADIRASLDDMRAEVREQETERAREADSKIAAAADAPSCESVLEALAVVSRERALSERGMRVRIDPLLAIYVRFAAAAEGMLHVFVEKRGGSTVAELLWSPGQPASDLVLRISEALRAHSLHPGEDFDGASLFLDLREALRTARSVKQRFSVLEDMAFAHELCGRQWMIYDWGLGGWSDDSLQAYYITLHDLGDDWERHMAEKLWVDQTEFRQALVTTRLLHEGGRLPG